MLLLTLCFAHTTNQVLYDKKVVKQVDVPSYSGSFGILANHVPVLAVIKPGVVTVFEEDGSANKFFGNFSLLKFFLKFFLKVYFSKTISHFYWFVRKLILLSSIPNYSNPRLLKFQLQKNQ